MELPRWSLKELVRIPVPTSESTSSRLSARLTSGLPPTVDRLRVESRMTVSFSQTSYITIQCTNQKEPSLTMDSVSYDDPLRNKADNIGGDKERAQEAGKKGGEASYDNGGLTQ